MNIINIYNRLPSFIKRLIDPYSSQINAFVARIAKESPRGARILDAGAGECGYKELFSHCKYISADFTLGDSKWDYSKLDVICDISKTPFQDNTFDAVLCTQVLEHVAYPSQVIKELSRVLNFGGKLYISAPQGWGVHQAPHDYFRFTNFALKRMIEDSGLEVQAITPSCGYFSYIANRLTVFPKVLFWGIKSKVLRLLFFPFELISYFLFVLFFPAILNSMDGLDKNRNYTLNYLVIAQKAAAEKLSSK